MLDPYLMQNAAVGLYYHCLAPLLTVLKGAPPTHPDLLLYPLTVGYTVLSALPNTSFIPEGLVGRLATE